MYAVCIRTRLDINIESIRELFVCVTLSVSCNVFNVAEVIVECISNDASYHSDSSNSNHSHTALACLGE